MNNVLEAKISDAELTALFGEDGAQMMEAAPEANEYVSIVDPAMAPVATSWPCVIAATIGAQC